MAERVYLNAATEQQLRVEIIRTGDAVTYLLSNGLTHTCSDDDCAYVNEIAAAALTRP